MRTVELVGGGAALVDDADWALVSQYKWRRHEQPPGYIYAEAYGPRRLSLHRLIMGAPPGKQVDHIDGDGLNCQRANMRICDAAQNQWNARRRADNQSGFKGVCFKKAHSKWCAQIRVRGLRYFLGEFDALEEAAEAYAEAAHTYHGVFARS